MRNPTGQPSENVDYLRADDVLTAARAACGFEVAVGEPAQFAANIARPTATAFGQDAYPGVWTKAAALLHSFATTQCLVDGNKRTSWASAWLMLRINGAVGVLTASPLRVDEAEQLVLDAAAGGVAVTDLADRLRRIAR
ncbi:type II toxin-antitoxin system death-on-curing family toxin [Tsukamurella spumae]|uniref:type II toxin-antitoxin system death-on-curing family toxin n=1 Tax=Tsukamurella spumae TaxID=44753 RepID=UPI0031E3C0B5